MNDIEKPRYNFVKEKADEVISENFIFEPPIEIRKLVVNYGLSLQFAIFKDNNICGFLDIDDKKIWVNHKDSDYRQNFTIAHELGHWLLHREIIEKKPDSYKILFRQPLGSQGDAKEIEANKFAANLLVPTNMLQICVNAKFTRDKMSKLFGVSQDVIGYRLQQEGYDGQ